MSITALIIAASCSWANPGANRFIGDPVSAIDHYVDIPKEARDALKRRVSNRDYSEIVEIKRDSIGVSYEPRLYDMHFGSNKLCKEVDRSSWSPKAVERGLVFCEQKHCVILPTVCGNLSRLALKPVQTQTFNPISAGGSGGGSPPLILQNEPLFEGVSVPVLSQSVPTELVSRTAIWPMAYEFWVHPAIQYYERPSIPVIPEPSTWVLLIAGIAALGLYTKRRN